MNPSSSLNVHHFLCQRTQISLHEYLNEFGAARVNMFNSSFIKEGLKHQCLIVLAVFDADCTYSA